MLSCAHLIVSHFVVSLDQLDVSNAGLIVVVPWSLSDDLQDIMSEPRVSVERIVKHKVD